MLRVMKMEERALKRRIPSIALSLILVEVFLFNGYLFAFFRFQTLPSKAAPVGRPTKSWGNFPCFRVPISHGELRRCFNVTYLCNRYSICVIRDFRVRRSLFFLFQLQKILNLHPDLGLSAKHGPDDSFTESF